MEKIKPVAAADRIQCKTLSNFQNIQHGFFTRQGGVSRGIYDSLNCGFGSSDRQQAVAENRERVAAAFSLESDRLISARQTHSAHAIVTNSPWGVTRSPGADAIITSTTGFAPAVLSADCAPVLLADPEASIIGAAHAGWKGALSGILANTVAEMIHIGAQSHNIHAVIGPTLSQSYYEVGPEFRGYFLTSSPQNACFFKQGAGDRFLFDLPGFVQLCLRNCGVLNISHLDLCTYGSESDFFSYRRSVHRDERDYGRQISVIGLV